MLAPSVRTLVAATLLAVASAPSAAFQDETPPTRPQACDGVKQDYDAPGGTATGTGTSAGRAKARARDNADHAVGLSLPGCDVCPDGTTCGSLTSVDYDNYIASVPVWDPILGVFTCSCRWDGCALEQTCYDCDR